MSHPLRKPATWQTDPGERILEYLESRGWCSPREIARGDGIHLTVPATRTTLLMLADGELVAPFDADYDLYALTTDGRLYLDGERDQELHPHPYYYGLATAPLL